VTVSGPIYLDWNATTPPHPAVVEAMARAASDAWGNPASVHRLGRRARETVEHARDSVAKLVGFCARDVVFTSGGTEANNLGVRRPFARPGGALVTSRLEHPSVVAVAEHLARAGTKVVFLEVDRAGRIGEGSVASALDALGSTLPVLVAVQAVNHETGVIQPVAAIARVVHERGAQLHVDAVQAVGRLGPDAWAGADSIAVAAHKLRGPKGIGALALSAGLVPLPLLYGGAQERGLRPGTVDPVGAAGFGAAAELAVDGASRYGAVGVLRDRIERALTARGALRHGDEPRAPHVTNVRIPGWPGDELVAALDLEGVCVSAGSACAAGTPEPSKVIAAMCGGDAAREAVRISLGEETTSSEIETAIAKWVRVLERQRSPA
jgi:cysteine desulfurase